MTPEGHYLEAEKLLSEGWDPMAVSVAQVHATLATFLPDEADMWGQPAADCGMVPDPFAAVHVDEWDTKFGEYLLEHMDAGAVKLGELARLFMALNPAPESL